MVCVTLPTSPKLLRSYVHF